MIEKVTELLLKSKMIYGFYNEDYKPISLTNLDSNNKKYLQRQHIDISSEAASIYRDTLKIAYKHKDFIIKLSNILLEKNVITGIELAELIKLDFPNIKVGKLKDTIYPDYSSYIK